MDNSNNGLILSDVEGALRFEHDRIIRRRQQDITSQFLDGLADDRSASANAPMGNYHKVAAIPVAIVEKWMSEGFNIFDKNVTIPEVLKRLHGEDMQNFIATTKSFR